MLLPAEHLSGRLGSTRFALVQVSVVFVVFSGKIFEQSLALDVDPQYFKGHSDIQSCVSSIV